MIVTFVMQLVDAEIGLNFNQQIEAPLTGLAARAQRVARASYQGCAALANAYFAKQLIGDDLISSILGYCVTG